MLFKDCASEIREFVNPEDVTETPYIGLEHIQQNSLYLNGYGVASEVSSSKAKFKKGDILFGKLRPYLRKVIVAPFDGVCSTDIWVVRAKESVNQLFLYYWMASEDFIDFSMQGSEGTKMPRAKWEHVSNHKIPFFDKSEQRAIATALSDVDGYVDKLERLTSKKRNIKKGVMQELLTGKRRLPGFGGEWVEKKIMHFPADVVSGGTPSTFISAFWGGSIPWMNSGELNLKRVYDVEGRITQLGYENSNTTMVSANSVLIGLAGQGKTRGTVAMNHIDLCTNQSIATILPNPSVYCSEYLYHNLDSRYDELRELSAGDGGRGGLNLTILRNLAVPFPSLAEQTAIAAVLTDMDAGIDALTAKLNKVRNIKQGMMQELLTGRIRLPVEEKEAVPVAKRTEKIFEMTETAGTKNQQLAAP